LEERGAQEGSTDIQEAGVALTQLLEQAGRALDICEEQGKGSGRELTHAAPPSAHAQHNPDPLWLLISLMALIPPAAFYLIILPEEVEAFLLATKPISPHH